MNRKTCNRWLIYIAGLVILALGLILNTKAGLGVSPILTTAYSMSEVWGIAFADMTLIVYCAFIVVEIILHLVMKREKSVIIFDLLQLPMSIVFTRVMNIFAVMIPNCTDLEGHFFGTIAGRLIVLAFAILFTGIGAATSLDMRIVPNPGDGIVQALADFFHKRVGFIKNCFDFCCITFSAIFGLLTVHHLIGIHIGTVCAVIGVGRIVALWNNIAMAKMLELSGVRNPNEKL